MKQKSMEIDMAQLLAFKDKFTPTVKEIVKVQECHNYNTIKL
jgi:hypothetical protein